MSWNLWLDDMRDPELLLKFKEMHGYKIAKYLDYQHYVDKGFGTSDFVWAKSAQEAISLVQERGMPDFMALDHDLGSHDVFVFLRWLAETQKAPSPDSWWVHSSNPNGAANIRSFLRSWHASEQ